MTNPTPKKRRGRPPKPKDITRGPYTIKQKGAVWIVFYGNSVRQQMYITVTKSDGVIQGIGFDEMESISDAMKWTDDRDLTSYECTNAVYAMAHEYGGDVMYYLDETRTAQFNGLRT